MNQIYAKYLINKTREDYNLISSDFSRTREYLWEESRFLFDDYIRGGDHVLDLGCGNGRYYQALKDKDINYTGIDNSLNLINIAKKKYPDINFEVADALNLSFESNSFDKIYSIAVLHHIPSRELRVEFLKEAKRVLKDNGLFILTSWKFHQAKEWKLLIKYTILKFIGISKLDYFDIMEPWANRTERYYHWFRKRELIGLAKSAGFKIKSIGVIKNFRGNRKNYYLVLEK
jgi:ubiquinone/menaquinone biosynthesis C-methylase UbiE